MSIIAAALKHMLAAGVPHEAILAAVADMEANLSKDEAAERRRAKDRERKSNVPRNSAESAESAERKETPPPSPDGPLSFPQTPILSPLNPPSTPKNLSSGSPDMPASEAKSKKVVKFEYPGEFEMWFAEYPRHAGVSKRDAYNEWKRLTPDELDAALEGTIVFAERCRADKTEERFIPHPNRFLKHRRFETLLEVAR